MSHISQTKCEKSPLGPREKVNIAVFICRVARSSSRRCTLGEFESLAIASRRRWRIFQEVLRRLRLRQKNSTRASDGPAGGSRVVACLRRWRAFPRAPRHAAFNNKILGSISISYTSIHWEGDHAPRRQADHAQSLLFGVGKKFC